MSPPPSRADLEQYRRCPLAWLFWRLPTPNPSCWLDRLLPATMAVPHQNVPEQPKSEREHSVCAPEDKIPGCLSSTLSAHPAGSCRFPETGGQELQLSYCRPSPTP